MDTVFKIRVFLIILFLSVFAMVQAQVRTEVTVRYRSNQELANQIENAVAQLINEANSSYAGQTKLSLDSKCFTALAINRINSIWENSPFYCAEGSIQLNLLKQAAANFELRNIPVLVNNGAGDVENAELVINVNAVGKVEDISFALDYHMYTKIMDNKLPAREYRQKKIITDFVENYRTAYNRKDIAFLDEVFSDNALIIVGRVIEPDLTSQEVKLADPEKVEYVKQNKSEYISHTKRVFASNKQIRVFFDDIDISISPKNDNIYGVQLLQTWRGDYYADKGYLFLMIDFTDDEHPKIYVRTWQPEKDEDLFDLGSFVF
ncbi:MAG TPA: hypothetical protein PL063_03060 [Candidatus Cloacimonadota bacterium]|nr:hypothetical protein [Candidatus Cloacimonadota bacterium]HQB41389.1 hypothetical protein [Candidatus Cloacimonadota bacterium]